MKAIAYQRFRSHRQGPRSAPVQSVLMRALSAIEPVQVTVTYTAALIGVAIFVRQLGPQVHAAVVGHLSTNLHNLAHGHLGTLIASAFITDDGSLGSWVLGLMCLLASGELVWRGKRLVFVFAAGHVGATLLVAVGLAVSIRAGVLPHSLASATDVGISYGAAAVLGALTATLPRPARPAWVGWWLGVAVYAAAGLDFTSIGHVLALSLGIALSLSSRYSATWTGPRSAVLAVGAGFGYLLITGGSAMPAGGGVVGTLVAMIGWQIARQALPTFRASYSASAHT